MRQEASRSGLLVEATWLLKSLRTGAGGASS